jgi:CheY-like chemotaxis protein
MDHPKKCVLCVDDDPAILQLHRHLLADGGYSVISAASGTEALQVLASSQAKVDAVVLDLSMPGMNGEELALQLRERYPELLLVAVSGVQELPVLMRKSVDAHLLKGPHPERILATLSEVFAKHRPVTDEDIRKTILCVEDEELQLELRKSVLASAGFRVLGARSAQAAIEIFEGEHIDLVVMDYWLSVKNGTAVAEEMKRLRPGTPIVMLSGFSSLPGEGAVVDIWLRKAETQPEDLVREVKRLVAQNRKQRQIAHSK